MVITGGTFESNASSVAGGAIYNTITTSTRAFSTDGTAFTTNSSLNGGAFYNNAGVATLTNTDFTTNSASSNGGAIFSTGGTMTITGNEFTSNSATNFGGAIYNDTGTTTNITNSDFSLNSALSGGAAYNIGGTLTLTDCSFSNNSATTSGGAIYVASGIVNVNSTGEDVTFTGNTQAGSGNDILMAGGTLNLTANNYDIYINGGIQGTTGTISKLGTGDLILSGTNNLFTGTYTNSAGNLQIKSAFFNGVNNFTAGTAEIQTGGSVILNSGDSWANTVITNSNATLNINGFSHTTGGAYNQTAGTLNLNNTGTASSLTLTSGSNFASGNVNFTGTGNTLSVGTGATFLSDAAINLTSSNNFTVSGGTATLNGTGTGTDTWAGTVNVSGGTLNLNSISSGGIYNQSGGATNLSTGSLINITAASDNLSGGSLVDNGTLNLSNTATKTVATSISGNGIINKSASGSVTFSGNNTNFTGTYNQTAGAVTIQNNFFSGINNFNGGTATISTGGNLTLNSNDSWTTTNFSTSSGTLNLEGFSHTSGGTYNQTLGNLNLNNASSLLLATGSTITSGNVNYSGTGSLLNIASGGAFSSTAVLNLTSDNTFRVSGSTNVTLSNADFWSGLGKVDMTSGTLTLASTTSNGIYTQSGGALTIRDGGTLTLGGNSSITAGSVVFAGTGIKTLDVATGGLFDSAATINISSGNIFKVSGGTATLSNADTWVGEVDVTGGSLALNSIASNGNYIQNGGTTTLSSGTLSISGTSSLAGGSFVDNATLNLSNTDAKTIATSISGTGTINKNAAGVSTFTSNISGFTGTYNQTVGGVVIQNNFFNGANNFTGLSTTADIQTGGNLTLNSGDTWTNTNTTLSGGSLTLNGFSHTTGGTYNQTSGGLHLNNSSSLTLGTGSAVSGGTVDFGGTGNVLSLATGGSFNSNIALDLSNGNTFRVSGGTSELNSETTWNGAIDLTGGTLTLNKVPISSGAKGTYSQSGGTSNFINQNLDTSGDIVLTGGIMNINTGNGSSGYINSKISATSGVINFNKTVGSNPTDGNIYLNKWIDPPTEVNLYSGTLNMSNDSYLDGNNLNLYGGNLNSQNNAVGTIALNNLTFGGTANWLINVDLANLLGDKITSTNPATGTGSLNINAINLLSDAGPNSTSVVVADSDTKSYLTNSVYEVDSALFKYGVSYDSSGTNGVLNFQKIGISPNARTGDVAQISTFLLQSSVNRQFFENIDSFMSFPLAQRESTICCALTNGKATGSSCPIPGKGTFSPIYSCDLNKGIWTKNFVSFENVPLKNGPNVSTIEYGTLVGGDTPFTKLSNGFVGNTSTYIGYLGLNQNYDQVGLSQNGTLFGVAENIVKKNFFITGMANVGYMAANAQTPWGLDNFSSVFAGAAVKSGYNFEFKKGNYIIQPNLMVAYSYIYTPPYTTASKLNMGSEPFNALQVVPGIRLIKNFKEQKGQVYLVANYVQNIMDNTRFNANDITLSQLSVVPYVEYGIGYQKVWKDRLTGFFQTLIRNGGVNGVALQFGLRWAF